MACGVGSLYFSSRWVTPVDYGHYGLFLSVVPLGMWVWHAGVIKGVARHWAASPNRRGLLSEVARATRSSWAWLSALSLVGAWALLPAAFPVLAVLLFCSIAALSVGTVAQTALQAERAHWLDFRVTALTSTARTSLPLLAYGLLAAHPLALAGGYTVHALLFAGVAAWTVRGQLAGVAPSSAPARQLSDAYTGRLFFVLAAVTWLLGGLQRWVVAAAFGPEVAGHFTLASNLAQVPASMLGSLFLQFYQPSLFAFAHASPLERRKLATYLDRIALGYTGIALCGLLLLKGFSPFLLDTLISATYRPALPWILGAGAFTAALLVGQFFHLLLLAAHRETACGRVDLSCAAAWVLGSGLTAWLGTVETYQTWLVASPLVPWLLGRTLARRALARTRHP